MKKPSTPAKVKPVNPRRADAAKDAVDVAFGQRLRSLRRARNLSLETVAARTALSVGYISQVERGLSSPSLRVLALLADVFGVSIPDLLDTDGGMPTDDPIVTHEHQRPGYKLWRTGISKQLLTRSHPESRLSVCHMELEPEASTGEELFSHEGEEAGFILQGELILIVESQILALKAGDCFRFASRRPHRYSNPSPVHRTVVLWVNALPPISASTSP